MTSSKLIKSEVSKLIGRRIFILRQSRKISREKFAAQIGICSQQLFKYEMGYNRITIDMLERKEKENLSFIKAKNEYRLIDNFNKLRQLSVDELIIKIMELLVK